MQTCWMCENRIYYDCGCRSSVLNMWHSTGCVDGGGACIRVLAGKVLPGDRLFTEFADVEGRTRVLNLDLKMCTKIHVYCAWNKGNCSILRCRVVNINNSKEWHNSCYLEAIVTAKASDNRTKVATVDRSQ